MKKIIFILCLALTSGLYAKQDSAKVSEKNFEHHFSGSFTGILNYKVRFQYERQLNSKSSYGLNFNYYCVNWTGPSFEPFIRIYGESTGNQSGFFGQAKLIYGNLKNLDWYDGSGDNIDKRWSTFGAGVSAGYKFMLIKHLTIEPLMGFRFLSPPVDRLMDSSGDPYYDSIEGGAEAVGWFLTTGLPLDFQLKVGWQF